ncbi:hypothetical protein AUEXF2481DRAFT_375077 [Aureobasidium subglaciale EXF-2481]|uniref:F-box domain-containing protein n=1 Tax=Aureobasidium subglaciale (strain EXF-2481) TaxID=1043005 RepID=A0A074ZJY5_AURSE|nr:uncharacterized protein AUEXF2481DRAFT_375077 [Aureobasidium subglaciale EXF-2481]KEQ98791.1 hypothetical protein AUEXF2481DRAFT_375077 [Aureobasidium subglaciale EXF-2481]
MMTDVSQSSGPSLDDMPPEILHIIYLYVYPDDIKALGCTSRQLQLVSAEYPTDEVTVTITDWRWAMDFATLQERRVAWNKCADINVWRKTVLETRTRL